MPRQTIADRLQVVQVALDNTQADPQLQAAFAAYGYDTERLNVGRQLYTAAVQLQQQQHAKRGDQIGATEQAKVVVDAANEAYMRFVKVARVALKNQRGALVSLDLVGDRKHTLAGWVGQAKQFYTTALANEAILAQLAEYGITAAKLRDGQEQLAAAEAANVEQKQHRGTAQQATTERNAAVRALNAWYGDFLKIARVAFADDAQQLEKLSIVVPL
jgi:hypothetical protein